MWTRSLKKRNLLYTFAATKRSIFEVTRNSTNIPAQQTQEEKELAEFADQLPIERRSLSRGLSINKFEKVRFAL